ncbi:MAG: 23S rRNA (pseudouridine(1915)-N(3))-methyltransferase RlmH [Candidatus Aminicenantes bacterium]|nr:23S rRNA (pseudouridine(1915)-N(3))-methyltransferase RlmH [Candidatus Aminicenantes bacterium]
MEIVFLWPGKTRHQHFRALQEEYLGKVSQFGRARIIETAEARGLEEKWAEKILEKEAEGLEKHLQDGYIICLSDKGKEMTSEELARLIEAKAMISSRKLIFLVGGFLGLAPRIMDKANFQLSLSRMTFSHELARVVLLEQVYRALNLIKGYSYPK